MIKGRKKTSQTKKSKNFSTTVKRIIEILIKKNWFKGMKIA